MEQGAERPIFLKLKIMLWHPVKFWHPTALPGLRGENLWAAAMAKDASQSEIEAEQTWLEICTQHWDLLSPF